MSLNVQLIAYTNDPVRVVASAAKLCYSASSLVELFEGLDGKNVRKFLSILRDSGHMSPFEHASFTFAAEGLSRVTTHQLVRHRIASYSQRSQRYVTMDRPACVMPPEVEQNAEARVVFERARDDAFAAYEKLVALGISAEDARFILPHGWETSIVVTMNARELLHFFELRLCRRAQWEILETARLMLARVYGVAKELFEGAGPSCIAGFCKEHRSCGMPYGSTEEILEGR
jgi:thymidylate synthase (FAD)